VILPGTVRERVFLVRERIGRAAARAGRSAEEIRLVAVGKRQPVERIAEAAGAGLTVFGENYVQEAEEKIRAWPGLEWHMIGMLQGNKVKKAVSLFSWIQTIDSTRLLSDVSRRCGEAGKVMPVLFEVNLGREPGKSGILPDDLPALVEEAGALPGVRVAGLMAIPPPAETPEGSRPWFVLLRELLSACRASGPAARTMNELSMGMSHDFEAAIEEGATMVRIGTAIFGSRPGRKA
jgi:PLP dependent protein